MTERKDKITEIRDKRERGEREGRNRKKEHR